MKNKIILICGLTLLFGVAVCAKDRSAAKTTLAHLGEGDYDIKHLKFNIHVTDTSKYIWGDVTTTAQVVATTMGNYIFELDGALTIDSAKLNGTILPVTIAGFVRTIALPTSLTTGTFFTAQIFYHGMPPSTGIPFFDGITHDISAGGTHMVYTVSDPWVAKNWWPSKQSVNDKIDSVDMYVTVPRGVADGSNGLLINVDTTTSPGYRIYHWQSHYPVVYYLISIAVAKYGEYRSYMHFTGSTDSMLIQNFLADTATFNPLYKANFDSLGLMVDYFSSLFGRYPFWQEKYGCCYTTLPGGMENQTMTTIGVPNTTTIAHELCHQWFGDHVSYARWGEVWLSEGFATFSEQLYLNHFWGAAAARAHRQTYLSGALGAICGQVFVTDTSGPATLFDPATVYKKGAMVVNMLRYIAPEDSLFFRVLRLYQQTYTYGHAFTTDLKAIAEAEYGVNLDTFFNQWIYGRGYPRYRVTWDQVGTTAIVKLVQSTSCAASTPHFSTHLQLQLHSATADTFIKVYNSLDTQVFTFEWTHMMDTVMLNPDIWTLCIQNGVIKQDTNLRYTLGAGNPLLQNVKIFPNPSKNYWQIDQLPDDTSLTLTDMNGRVIWQGKSTNGSTVIPGANIPAGNYLLKISGGNNAASIKLVHW